MKFTPKIVIIKKQYDIFDILTRPGDPSMPQVWMYLDSKVATSHTELREASPNVELEKCYEKKSDTLS